MLIDWDNLQICHSRDAPGTDLDLHALIALSQSYGTLVSARAYAEWNLLSERLAVYKAGIEPVFAPVMRPEGSAREGKSLADTVMVADGVDLLWTVSPDVFVLVTSDKDMIPLARIAKQRGAAVVVLGSDLTAIPLVEMSNVFITYRQLLRELDRVVELEAPSGRAPARERRLRESRRPSSEPYTGSGPIGTQGQLGAATRPTSRTVSRPVSLHSATRTVEPALPRRSTESTGPSEGGRSLTGPAPQASSSTLDAADTDEQTPLAATDATPRRRRRRGGRGRRPGTDALGGPETTGGERTDGAEEAKIEASSDQQAASAPRADDLDTAVLELLASRDRETDASPEMPPSGQATSDDMAPSVQAEALSAEPEAPRRETAPGRRPIRRRPITTTFSEFGPPSVGRTRTAPESPEAPTSAEPEPVATTPESISATAGEGEAASDAVSDTTVSVTASVDGGEVPTPSLNEATTTEAAEANVARLGEAVSPAIPEAVDAVESGTAEAPTENGQVTTEEPAADAEASRPAPRRRTRRPTRRTPSKSKADAPAEAPVAAESGA